MVIRVSDEFGCFQVRDDLLAVRYGASVADWEEAADPDRFVELIDGKLIMHSAVSLQHAEIFGFVHWLLKGFVDERNLGKVLTGPFTMELSPDRKFEPVLLFVSTAHLADLHSDRLLGPADLAIEIASPSTSSYDRTERREAYRVGGMRKYWMIDPYQRVVIVDRPAGHETGRFSNGRIESQLCTGFSIKAEWLWADPLPAPQACLRGILNA